jgi:hypothetical protein
MASKPRKAPGTTCGATGTPVRISLPAYSIPAKPAPTTTACYPGSLLRCGEHRVSYSFDHDLEQDGRGSSLLICFADRRFQKEGSDDRAS